MKNSEGPLNTTKTLTQPHFHVIICLWPHELINIKPLFFNLMEFLFQFPSGFIVFYHCQQISLFVLKTALKRSLGPNLNQMVTALLHAN